MAPRISVIIPVHNGERYLGEALRSVVEQWLPADEILVVDDGSTDHSVEIVRGFPRVRWLSQRRAGQARAIDAGVAATTGEWLAFLDADDRWLPEKLQLQAAMLATRCDVDIVFGHARQFVEPGLISRVDLVTRALPARLPSSMLLRRSAWARAGAFSGEWAVGSVIEWCARVDDRGLRWLMLDAIVYERRVHALNSSATHPDSAREYARALKHVLDTRRRQAAPTQSAPAKEPRGCAP